MLSQSDAVLQTGLQLHHMISIKRRTDLQQKHPMLRQQAPRVPGPQKLDWAGPRGSSEVVKPMLVHSNNRYPCRGKDARSYGAQRAGWGEGRFRQFQAGNSAVAQLTRATLVADAIAGGIMCWIPVAGRKVDHLTPSLIHSQ